MIVRALAPAVIATDEVGGESDAAAIADALRCGVRVMATAHAASLKDALRRKTLAPLLDGAFDIAVELERPAGSIRAVYAYENGAWKRMTGE